MLAAWFEVLIAVQREMQSFSRPASSTRATTGPCNASSSSRSPSGWHFVAATGSCGDGGSRADDPQRGGYSIPGAEFLTAVATASRSFPAEPEPASGRHGILGGLRDERRTAGRGRLNWKPPARQRARLRIAAPESLARARVFTRGLRQGPVGDQLVELAAAAVAETKPQSVNATLPAGFPIHITLRSILPGTHHLLLCLEDGSVVQRANEKWRQVEVELRSVLDSVSAGVLLIDPLGRVRFSSARFVQLFSLDVRAMAQMSTFEGIVELLADRFRNPEGFSSPWRAFSTGLSDPGHDELEMTRPTRRLLERFYRPVLDTEGRSVGWLELYSGRHRRAPDPVEDAADGKNGCARPTRFRHRARTE